MDVPFHRTDILCRRLFMRPADTFRMERVPELFIYGYHKYQDDVNLSGADALENDETRRIAALFSPEYENFEMIHASLDAESRRRRCAAVERAPERR